jgi:tetratricopeptide (TPR) repeat protein
LNPGDNAAFFNRGLARDKRGDPSGAVADFERVVRINPADHEAWLSLGLMKEKLGDLDGALAAFNRAVQSAPNYSRAYGARGWVNFVKNDFTAAVADAERAIQVDPHSGYAYGTRGWARHGGGDVAGAVEDLKRAVKLLGPDSSGGLTDQGLLDFINGDPAKAADSWERAARTDAAVRRELQPWIGKARAGLDARRESERRAAQALLEKEKQDREAETRPPAGAGMAAEPGPTNALGFYTRGLARFNRGDLEGAIADYSRVIVLEPRRAAAHVGRGVAKQKLGDLDGAIRDFSQSLRINPNDAKACNNRGWARLQQKDFNGAMADATRAVALDSTNGYAYGTRAWARYGKGDTVGAAGDCKMAVKLLSPGSFASFYNQGLLDFINGDSAKAVACWKSALEKDPTLTRELQPWIEKAQARPATTAQVEASAEPGSKSPR